jgi:aldehyde dehydrogenase (NAD+)
VDDNINPTLDLAVTRVFALQRANRNALKAQTAEARAARLLRLRTVIVDHVDEINEALHRDLRKMPLGLKAPEINAVLKDIDEAIKNLAAWMQPDIVACGASFGGNDARVRYEPRGVVLLFGPWNFPFALIMQPLVPIIAAGNAVIVKPNELQPFTSAIVTKILREAFTESEVAVFEGGIAVANSLLQMPFDHIFFTGSPAVGRQIMAAAAKHLASVTLELGGKCPAVIGMGANLDDAAAKIVGARFYNAGQLCLAVDHVWVPFELREALVQKIVQCVNAEFYIDGILQTARLARIVNLRNLERIRGYLEDAQRRGATIKFGGDIDTNQLTIHPTILVDVPEESRMMQEEIFGPLLPVLGYQRIEEVSGFIDRSGKPLAIYVFSPDPDFVESFLQSTSSGGVTVNGVLSHAGESRLPFGGVNQSGIGRYKGIHGFRELSHARSVFSHPPAKAAAKL